MRSVTSLTAAALVIAALTSTAGAADVEGKIQSYDAGERAITLDNGTKIFVADGVATDGLREGVDVTISYEEKDGKNVATSVGMK
jgi:uncharacterized protein DUF1344